MRVKSESPMLSDRGSPAPAPPKASKFALREKRKADDKAPAPPAASKFALAKKRKADDKVGPAPPAASKFMLAKKRKADDKASAPTTASEEAPSSKKRKADDKPEDKADTKAEGEDDVKKPLTKRAKQKQRAKLKGMRKPKANGDPLYADLDEENGLNPAIGKMDPSLLADFIARQTKKHEPELSVVELEDRRVPENAILDTSAWMKVRTLDDLPKFLEKYSPRKKAQLQEASENNGEPHTVVVTASGVRAVDLKRALSVFQTKESQVGKLFAKHIKLEEAVETTKNTRMGIGVGTPRRLIDLIEAGVLSVSTTERILVDASHVNGKKQGILNMPEIQVPLTKLLANEKVRARYADGSLKIIVY